MLKRRGFTLIEILITVALVTIVLGLAIPPMKEMVARNRLAAQSTDLIAALRTARATAVQTGQPVSLCPNNPATNPERNQCSAVADWSKGWIIVKDRARDCTSVDVVTVSDRPTGITSVKQADQGVDCINFTTQGFALAPGERAGKWPWQENARMPTNTTLTICEPTLKESRIFEILPSGTLGKTTGTCL